MRRHIKQLIAGLVLTGSLVGVGTSLAFATGTSNSTPTRGATSSPSTSSTSGTGTPSAGSSGTAGGRGSSTLPSDPAQPGTSAPMPNGHCPHMNQSSATGTTG